MASNPPGSCCTLGSLHEGQPTGQDITIDGDTAAYLATPPAGKAHEGVGVLYLPDVLGIWQNSKLMADSFAANGYLTIIPDLFNNDQLAVNRPDDFDIMGWITKGTGGNNPHTPEYVDAAVLKGIKALQDRGVTKIGAVGYCFGGKYVVRHYKNGIKVGYSAHPSFVSDEELAAITGPFSIAAAETDSIFTTELRHKSEGILAKTGQPWQINLFSGTEHGFSVRGDLSDPKQRFAKERAFAQSVEWFDQWLLKA
jgi:dienelactone hydrolase